MFIARLAKLRLKLTQEWQKMSLVRSLFTFETRLQRALGPDRGFRSANARPGGNGTSSQRGQGLRLLRLPDLTEHRLQCLHLTRGACVRLFVDRYQ